MFRSSVSKSLRRTSLLLACFVFLQAGRSADDKRLAIYTPNATFTHRVEEINGQEYVSILDVLQPIASVNVKSEKGAVRVKANAIEFQFQNGGSKVRIGRRDVELGGAAIVEAGRIVVPLSSLTTLVQAALRVKVDFHIASRRLFLDNAGTRFAAQLRAEASTLALTFSQPVAPSISTEGGQMRLSFRKEPVLPPTDGYNYGDKLFNNLQFVPANGGAEIVVNGSSPLLASFTDGGKTILITAAPSAPVAQNQPQGNTGIPSGGESPALAAASPPVATATVSQSPGGAVRYFVMIDPAHGGSETGARFSSKLVEKDITLAIARRLKAELLNRGVTAVLLRDGDEEVTVEQRALASNSQRAALFVSIHAGAPGGNVRVFTALMPSAPPTKGLFVPWESAQSQALERSRMLALETVSQLASQKIAAYNGTAPLSPLNSVAAPAIALEVGPPKMNSPVESLTQQSYQQAIAVAAASAIVSARAKMEAAR